MFSVTEAKQQNSATVASVAQQCREKPDANGWQRCIVLTDNCADENVCSVYDFPWIKLLPGVDPCLEVANGVRLQHYGEKIVPFWFDSGE